MKYNKKKNNSKRTFFSKIFSFGTLILFSRVNYSIANDKDNKKTIADLIVVWKSKRKMSLFFQKKHIKTYNIKLGFNPIGPKQKEGDGKTPEGRYFITHHNPNSAYHLSLGINYPNQKDMKNAKEKGFDAGGNIFIHGGPENFFTQLFVDWTKGCIAVYDHEIEEIYQMVPDGTTVYIYS